ncbi:Predicted nucleotidyltransferase [Lentibacillus persicus]|uniref:tRNA(Met) cytidine acetate ligase n=1 Tax=Lentibacillus persicus TaxID=640948 RepID=A0A1I1VIS3_9BACI|nr:nucleotidyltransferase [Lentibacillus persicus]SFD82814.1 Predicted nucleotidyltransferase [Lentibacillus persicus]
MQACGLIVEYNPFHNGHAYHIQESRKTSGADCIIAVMSGSFLQRGEPAIIDKFHRTKAALSAGVDVVLELPYLYAVQSSDLFAEGAVKTLYKAGVSTICFGSESGDISYFIHGYHALKNNQATYQTALHEQLDKGTSFPEASRLAYKQVGLTTDKMDLAKPNNILGFGYVKSIMDNELPIEPLTINRIKSNYHDQTITGSIASATSIREELLNSGELTKQAQSALPEETISQLLHYKQMANSWHSWEQYFGLVQYRVMTMSTGELAAIHGVDEGLEYRIKKYANNVTSFHEWMRAIKTKRYTWTRLQRVFAHILTNTAKAEMSQVKADPSVPYVRLLGMTKKGQEYLNSRKKQMDVPLITALNQTNDTMAQTEEKASSAYYSILPPRKRNEFRRQELQPPIMI